MVLSGPGDGDSQATSQEPEEMPWEELGEGKGDGERKWRRKRVVEEEWEAGKQEGEGGKKDNSLQRRR